MVFISAKLWIMTIGKLAVEDSFHKSSQIIILASLYPLTVGNCALQLCTYLKN